MLHEQEDIAARGSLTLTVTDPVTHYSCPWIGQMHLCAKVAILILTTSATKQPEPGSKFSSSVVLRNLISVLSLRSYWKQTSGTTQGVKWSAEFRRVLYAVVVVGCGWLVTVGSGLWVRAQDGLRHRNPDTNSKGNMVKEYIVFWL